MLSVVNIGQKLEAIKSHWQQQTIGSVNDFDVKLVKISGPFIWHHHQAEDEMFLVISGKLLMNYRENGAEHVAVVNPGEFVIVPHGTEHMPVAEGEVHIMLIEPATTVRTGNVQPSP